MQFFRYVSVLAFLLSFVSMCHGCGMITHTEITVRAQQAFYTSKYPWWNEYMTKHWDALEGGSPYPDSGYLCKSPYGEATHWPPFIKAAVEHIRETYPKPWSEETEKLVTFILGVESHDEADVLWHWGPNPSPADDQGFLHAMSHSASWCHDQWNSGEEPICHTLGDTGGDLLLAYRGNLNWKDWTTAWYVPTKDLSAIYTRMNITVSADEIGACMAVMYIGERAERFAAGAMFPYYGWHAAFLAEEMNDWFSGGLDDMAANAVYKWRDVIQWLETGAEIGADGSSARLDYNMNDAEYRRDEEERVPPQPSSSSLTAQPRMHHFESPVAATADEIAALGALMGFRTETTERGVRFTVSPHRLGAHPLRASQLARQVMTRTAVTLHGHGGQQQDSPYAKITPEDIEKLIKLWAEMELDSIVQEAIEPSSNFPNSLTVTTLDPYAYLGAGLATGDFDGDGRADLALGAPGIDKVDAPDVGGVFVTYGFAVSGKQVSTVSTPDLDGGAVGYSRFGAAVAAVDFNLDGVDDLVVSAPATGPGGPSPLADQYPKSNYGRLFVYFGQRGKSSLSNVPDVVIDGGYGAADSTLNLGTHLYTGDFNGDGHADLLIGSPFAQGGGDTRGRVHVLLASKNRAHGQSLSLSSAADWSASGRADHEWYGYAMAVGRDEAGRRLLFVGAPGARPYNDTSIQAGGRVYALLLNNTAATPAYSWSGGDAQIKVGQSLSFGYLRGSSDPVLAIGAPSYTHGTVPQCGAVFLVPVRGSQSSGDVVLASSGVVHASVRAALFGLAPFARFGYRVVVADLDGDGCGDVVVSPPLRVAVVEGADEGAVYIWKSTNEDLHSGPSGSTSISSDFRVDDRVRGSRLGKMLAVADVDGSGARDVILAAPYSSDLDLVDHPHARYTGRAIVLIDPLPQRT